MRLPSKDQLLRTAEKLVVRGRYAPAVEQYLKVLKSNQDDPILLNTVGDLLSRQGKSFEASGYFSRAADSYEQQGFPLKAIATLRKADRQTPDNLGVQQKLAELYFSQGLYDDAARYCQTILARLAREGGSEESVHEIEGLVARMAQAKAAAPPSHVAPHILDSPALHETAREDTVRTDGTVSEPVPISQDIDTFSFQEIAVGDHSEICQDSSAEAPEAPVEASSLPVVAARSDSAAVADLGEMLKEVDFYLRLGMQAEGSALLDRVKELFPDASGLAERERALGRPLCEPWQPVVSNRIDADLDPSESDWDSDLDRAMASLFEPNAVFSGGQGRIEAPAPSESMAAPESVRTHLDLGLAYREMGLLQDAVLEFERIAAQPGSETDVPDINLCHSLLAGCCNDLGQSAAAERWARAGLGRFALTDYERKVLQHNLGRALEAQGRIEEALEAYRLIPATGRVHDINEKIQDLEALLAAAGEPGRRT
jgi:tetratricopeptide (TPR) repeat protein